MELISRESVENIILDNKATHHSERIDADDVCNFEQVRRIQSRMDEDDDIGEKLSKLPSAFEGMTNGEVLKSIFPTAELLLGNSDYLPNVFSVKEEWWNSPYQKGGEGDK